jgi:uncharacterized protein
MDAHHRKLLFKSWTRTLHIYISMLGLLAVIFFSVTGIMLNHEEWFGFAAPHITNKEGTLPEAMATEPDKLAIVEKLRKEFGVTGAMDSFEVETDELRVVFKSAGRRAEATLHRADGHAEVMLETHGFSGRLAELHRGTDAGAAWRLWVIDGTAIVLLLMSLTGLVLWCFVPRWRPFGLVALGVCALICFGVYFAFVP